jgi:hypothetical protein
MTGMRDNDPTDVRYLRARSRIARGETGWIVRTREGTCGPFATETEAWAYASVYVDTTRFLHEAAGSLPEEVDASNFEVIEITLPRWC